MAFSYAVNQSISMFELRLAYARLAQVSGKSFPHKSKNIVSALLEVC